MRIIFLSISWSSSRTSFSFSLLLAEADLVALVAIVYVVFCNFRCSFSVGVDRGMGFFDWELGCHNSHAEWKVNSNQFYYSIPSCVVVQQRVVSRGGGEIFRVAGGLFWVVSCKR